MSLRNATENRKRVALKNHPEIHQLGLMFVRAGKSNNAHVMSPSELASCINCPSGWLPRQASSSVSENPNGNIDFMMFPDLLAVHSSRRPNSGTCLVRLSNDEIHVGNINQSPEFHDFEHMLFGFGAASCYLVILPGAAFRKVSFSNPIFQRHRPDHAYR